MNIIFDLDGVIFDSERIIIDCWKTVAQKWGIPNIEQVCKRCIGVTEEETIKILNQEFGDRFPVQVLRKETFDLFKEFCANNDLPLKRGVREILNYLKHINACTAIASSTPSSVVRDELKNAGIDTMFDFIVGGEQVNHSKPSPEIFLLTAKKMGVSTQDCFVIEDSYNGIKAASAAKTHPIMIPDVLPPNLEMYQLAEEIHNSLFETCNFFKNLYKMSYYQRI